jgi:hypothetical protein
MIIWTTCRGNCLKEGRYHNHPTNWEFTKKNNLIYQNRVFFSGKVRLSHKSVRFGVCCDFFVALNVDGFTSPCPSIAINSWEWWFCHRGGTSQRSLSRRISFWVFQASEWAVCTQTATGTPNIKNMIRGQTVCTMNASRISVETTTL